MNRLYYIIIAILCAVASACSHDEPPTLTPVHPEDAPGSRRTILVYMVSTNNLGTPGYGYDELNLSDMERWIRTHNYSSLNDCNVVVYHVPNTGNPGAESPVTPLLKRLTSKGFVVEKTYEPLQGLYAVNASVMEGVIDDVRSMYPAREYALVMWSHSYAWIENENTLSRGWGLDRGYNMSLPSLASVLSSDGRNGWELIYFDSCFGANIETAYALRHASDYIVGSSTEIPGWGMPYFLNIRNFLADELDPVKIASTTFDYYDGPDSPTRSCTMSVIETSKLDGLATACREIWADGASIPSDYRGKRFTTSSAAYHPSYDMGDLYHNLDGVSEERLAAFDAAYTDAVVYHAATPTMWGVLSLEGYSGMGHYIVRSMGAAEALGYFNQEWWQDVMSAGSFEE